MVEKDNYSEHRILTTDPREQRIKSIINDTRFTTQEEYKNIVENVADTPLDDFFKRFSDESKKFWKSWLDELYNFLNRRNDFKKFCLDNVWKYELLYWSEKFIKQMRDFAFNNWYLLIYNWEITHLYTITKKEISTEQKLLMSTVFLGLKINQIEWVYYEFDSKQYKDPGPVGSMTTKSDGIVFVDKNSALEMVNILNIPKDQTMIESLQKATIVNELTHYLLAKYYYSQSTITLSIQSEEYFSDSVSVIVGFEYFHFLVNRAILYIYTNNGIKMPETYEQSYRVAFNLFKKILENNEVWDNFEWEISLMEKMWWDNDEIQKQITNIIAKYTPYLDANKSEIKNAYRQNIIALNRALNIITSDKK